MSDTPIEDVAAWLYGGSVASIIQVVAVLAVAVVGWSVLWGHVSVRRGGLSILGCFVMFGSGAIATALVGGSRTASAVVALPVTTSAPKAKTSNPAEADPYAGASLAQ